MSNLTDIEDLRSYVLKNIDMSLHTAYDLGAEAERQRLLGKIYEVIQHKESTCDYIAVDILTWLVNSRLL